VMVLDNSLSGTGLPLSAIILHDEAGGRFFNGPWRREAACVSRETRPSGSNRALMCVH
jgi:hypothetical protein